MKVYFCDSCNESIPLKDINTNRITIEEGRIYCQECAPMVLRSKARAPLLMQVLIVVALLVGAAGLGFGIAAHVGSDALQRDVARLEADSAKLASTRELAALQQSLVELDRRLTPSLQDAKSQLGKLETELRVLDSQQSEGDNELRKRLETDIAALSGRTLAALKELSATAEEAGLQRSALLRDVERLTNRLDRLLMPDGAIGLGGDPSARPGSSGVRVPADPAPAPVGAGAAPDATIVDLAKLSAAESTSDRLSAVITLGDHRGRTAREALEARLQDSELHIRVAAIRALVQSRAVRSVPKLCDAALDKDEFVRQAAIEGLQELTRVPSTVPDTGDRKAIERAAMAWRVWYESQRTSLAAEAP